MRRRNLLGAVAAGVLVLGASCPANAQVRLNLSSVLPESNFMVKNAQRFAEAVKEATGGAVLIAVRSGGALGFKGPDQLTAVRDGLVEMADINISQQVGVNPLFGVEGIPFLVRSMDELKTYHQIIRPEFEKLALQNRQKILYMTPSPAQYIYLKVKVSKIDDFRGIPVRGADKNTVDIVSALGAAGVAMPWGEVIPALASGRIAGVATSATSGVDGKFWEFLKYIHPTNHTWGSNMVTIGLESWGRIPSEHQRTIERLAAELEPQFWEVSRKGDLDSIATMTGHGMDFVELADELRAKMAERGRALQEAFMERVPASRPLVERFLATVGR